MGTRYLQSPMGIARHAWCNKPDIKYNADGLYHVDLVLGPAAAVAYEGDVDAAVKAAQDYQKAVDSAVEQAWEQETAKLAEKAKEGGPKFDLKKWAKYSPYEVEEEDGTPTGNLIFKFKQNAKIKLRDGGTKTFVLGIRDSQNKATTANVFGGAVIRTLYAPRNVVMSGLKQIGSRLDFSMVQLIKPAPMSGGGFDEVDGGYTDEADSAGPEVTGETEY